ncbi:hypothetical protein Sta7437_4329 [Stanieria cyanosphaera PCC 7437]|uniref:Uncharacterized protein n=1 Tax=Stanieria cyanosphaera (strain ATCC 29371 / PCC 7437) TaxID=111780 RepID=K9XZ54_STAC7|nr:hypothetical protein [Stanieria cyanosphaera]AFZ37798.1 hypothetical protein Sta7437_4329 [Stanieria cyanosphaera PCC 7437]
MFGKPREPQKPEQPNLQDIKLSIPQPEPVITQQDTVLQKEKEPELEEKSELVLAVEKISRIVSPYFIVVVGLSLYEKNFLIGTILIVVGILSLLKISANDVARFFEWFKDFLGLGNSK